MATFIASNGYEPPAAELLPKELHPLRDKVIAAREAWQTAAQRQRAAEIAAGSADRDFKASLSAAAHRGDDPSKVVDTRQAKAEAATRASQDTEACAQALTSAWWSFTEAVAARADELIAAHEPAMADKQQRAQQAVDRYVAARSDLGAALSYARWLAAVSDAFGQGRKPPRFGPSGTTSTVEWVDPRGKHRTMAAADLVGALRVDSAGLDSWHAQREREVAIEARRLGDRQAQKANVPEGKIDLRPSG